MTTARATADVKESPLRSFEEWEKSLRNFAWLGDVVPGGMDLDFLVERRGNFLVIEGKPWMKGVSVPYGQHLALYAMSKLPTHRVYLVGEDGDRLHLLHYNDARAPVVRRYKGKAQAWWPPERFIPSDRDGLRTILSHWWNEASA